MSSSEFPRSATATESNIPVPKRQQPGLKRTKGCARLPELQRYIETIIKASSECESEDAALSEREAAFPKKRKFGQYSVCKGRERAKRETGRKTKNKAKTLYTEAVSTGGGEVAIMSVSDFDDPRNWRSDGTRSRGPDPELGNFLEKFFPNPYHLKSVQNAAPDPLPDYRDEDVEGNTVPISVCTQTEVQSESTDNAFATAHIEIKPYTRESVRTFTLRAASSQENCSRPISRRGGLRESNVSVGSKSTGEPTRTTTPSIRVKSSHSTVNLSSRGSSLESFGGMGQANSPRAKKSRLKSTLASGKGFEKDENDYDIGKLKLLSMTDSEDSITKGSKNSNEENPKQTTSGKFNEVSEWKDLSDLKEIYDVMNKATESFLELTIKTEQTALDISINTEDEKLMLNEYTEEDKKDDQQLEQDDCKKYDAPEIVTAYENEEKTQETEGTVTNSYTNFSQKEEKNESVKEKSPKFNSDEEDSSMGSQKSNKDAAPESEETGQRIDEVLQYMYDCLRKFSSNNENKKSSETSLVEDEKGKTNSQEGENKEKANPEQMTKKDSDHSSPTEDVTESFFAKSNPRVKEIQSESCTFLDRCKRKSIMTTRHRKKQEKNSTPNAAEEPANVRPSTSTKGQEQWTAVAKSLESHSTADSLRMSRDDPVQIAETQNELGSYSERVVGDVSIGKSNQTQSVRRKKSKTDGQKTIKEALETEERLFENFLSPKPEKKVAEKAADSKARKPGSHAVVRSGRTASSPFITDFKRSNSNFVICVSSLPRNLRTLGANRTSLTLSPSLSLSLNDISKGWDIKPITYYPKALLKKIPVIPDVCHSALHFKYSTEEGILLTGNRNFPAYIAVTVFLKQIIEISKSQEELSLKNSECLLNVTEPPEKKSVLVESSTSTHLDECVMPQKTETENSQRIDSLLEALERTEGRLMLLEQNDIVNSETASSSGNETYKCNTSELEWENDNSQEKVQDLLMRTYNLQHKLYQYLHKVTCVPPAPICPLMHHEQCLRLSFMMKDNDSVIKQNFEQSEQLIKVSKVANAEVQTNENVISHNPSAEENEDEEIQNEDNNDDDNSSVCSFKSSNDFSEEAESNFPQRGEILQKIFNEIDSFKQSFMTAKKDSQLEESNKENSENPKENRIAEYDPKTPTKMLRTVFKGKESSTELTIGLKDVPMTQVSNISVEKQKFSPNHTKISICILKEKSEKSNNFSDAVITASSNVLHNKISTMYFDQIRPSLSRCHTTYTRPEDDDSKTSESVNGSSEEDDDDEDYKSVGSSPSNPNMTNQEEPKDGGGKSVPKPPQKTFTKYRFDFYRKMDMSLEAGQTKPKPLSSTMCRYKELEPLKQALTEMQIRMRSIKQDNIYNSSEYYDRALKLAKMSAGYCQSCGNRTVIPKDSFGYYKTLLPRRYTTQRHGRHFKMAVSNPSYYSFRTSNCDSFCDLDIKHSSGYLLNRPAAPFLRSSFDDMPILIGRI